jgi:hypothetical protein
MVKLRVVLVKETKEETSWPGKIETKITRRGLKILYATIPCT